MPLLLLATDQNQNHSKFMSGDTGQPITHGWRPAVGAFVTASYVICCQPFLFFFCHLLSPICKARKISPHIYQCCYVQYMWCCSSDWAEALKSVKCQQALPASRFNMEKEAKATMMHSKMHQQWSHWCNVWYKMKVYILTRMLVSTILWSLCTHCDLPPLYFGGLQKLQLTKETLWVS